MEIERTNKEVIIRIPSSVKTDDLQEILNYVRYKEITSKFKVSPKKIDNLIKTVNKNSRKKFASKTVK